MTVVRRAGIKLAINAINKSAHAMPAEHLELHEHELEAAQKRLQL